MIRLVVVHFGIEYVVLSHINNLPEFPLLGSAIFSELPRRIVRINALAYASKAQ